MEKEFIPYKQALELKELGFDEPCLGLYYGTSIKEVPEFLFEKRSSQYSAKKGFIDAVLAPLYQQAFRWFREKYNLLGNIYSNASGYCWEIHDSIGCTHRFDSGESGDCEESGMFTTYKKAELACIKKLIEIVKNKN
jgi:hypothetical protein